MKVFGRKLFRSGKAGGFEPKVIVFCCSWSSHAEAAPVGSSGLKSKTRMIRTMCSGKVDPSFILKAFSSGIDGVMLTVCGAGDCHYMAGNYQAMRRMKLLQNMLQQLGIEPERLRLEWVSTADGAKLQSAVSKFVDKIAALGPV